MVVDDHAPFRAVIKAMLETAAWECVECRDGRDAVEQYARSQPDLVLMDISMEHLDGLRATAQLKARFPSARVIILTQYNEADLRAAACQAGACAYVLKEDLMDLPTAIQAQTAEMATHTTNGSSRR